MNKKQLQRMLELADVKKPINESRVRPSNIELVKKANNNKVYAIVRENSKYYIKESVKLKNLTESDFNYIGGIQNKPKYSYRSFEEASKNLNFMFEDINHNGNSDMVNILESDEELLKEKKFVLKLDKKKSKKSKEDEFDFGDEEGGEEEFDFGGEDTEGDTEEGGEGEFDFGGEDTEGDTEEGGDEDFDFGDEEGDTEEGGDEDLDFEDEEGGEEDLEFDDSEDDIKDIQSTTGKLGQQLRDVEDISSDMQKWVAKSVLSALDLDNMDSDDKKDIIRTIKKKSEEETDEVGDEEMDFGDEGGEEFDFGGEEEMEESYDNYMDDEDDFDGMGSHDWEGSYEGPFGKRTAQRPMRPRSRTTPNFNNPVDNEFPSRAELSMRDIDMGIQDKGYLNLDDPTASNPYDSYMEDSFNERSFESFMDEMEEAGMTGSKYDSYMEDGTKEDNPHIGGDEDDENLLLDFDLEGDMDSDELDALYGPNSTRRYSRSSYDRARRQADKDISRHYYDPAAPGYGDKPVEDWASHRLPYDTEFMGESRYLREDHLNDEMETYEQERAYEDVEAFVRRYGMDVELCHKESNEDPEESIVYLDIVDGKKKLLKVRINSVGDIEVGEMKGKNFVGEPVDSVEDFVEIFGEDLTNKEREDLDMDITMAPQPQRAPEKQPNEPATKPGRPERKSPSERPSRRPFTPPPTITPGEEPGPKAGTRKRR